jgi:DNA-binding HxlR family transcriptional regulator
VNAVPAHPRSAEKLTYLQIVSGCVKSEFVDLIGRQHTLRVLLLLRARGPLRFNEIQRALDLNANQVNRALSWLHERLYILAETVPADTGPLHVAYTLGKRGRAFLDAFDSFVGKADEQRAALGGKSVDELHALG